MRLLPLLLVVLNLAAPAAWAEPLANRLADHPSPYLAAHGADPVHWQLWGEETVERARRENKLLFVSSGYFSCHWCHVMQRESFQDPRIAALLNRHFIPVKVDRELEPALDSRLIDFVQNTRGFAGWPLNVFVTPEGYPLVGLVYLPPADFRELTVKLSSRWTTEPDQLTTLAKAAADALQPPAVSTDPNLPAGVGPTLERALVDGALALADEFQGGFGAESKFPSVPPLRALLAAQAASGNPQLEEFLRLTLDHMAQGGLRDHLGGGFFRYTVDPGWHVPHFEKMLYDNAQLAGLYLQAAEVLNQPAYEAVGRETLDFMLREMALPGGGFLASLSAVDEQGEEGGYYLWQRAEIRRLLSEPEWRVAVQVWGLEAPPALEGGHHLEQIMTPAAAAARLGLPERQVRSLVDSARTKLHQARTERGLPRDGKRLAAWNGLALSALARGARLTDGERYRQAGTALRDYLLAQLWDGKQLYRARGAGGPLGDGALEDYAYVAQGLWDWSRATGTSADLPRVRAIVEQAWQRFHGADGWRLAEHSLLRYGGGEAAAPDGAMPSPSAVLAGLSLELAGLQRDGALERRALAALNGGIEAAQDEPFWHASHVAALAAHQRSAPPSRAKQP